MRGKDTEIFVSWSGSLSHNVAIAFAEWIPTVVHNAKPFVSSRDLESGGQWMAMLLEKLKACRFAVLCLTRENVNAPWILFEAGAVAKGFDTSHVVPLVIDLPIKDLQDPLRQLNAVAITQKQVRKLIGDINKRTSTPADATTLTRRFDALWPGLEDKVNALVKEGSRSEGRGRYDIFLSAPMAAHGSDAEYEEHHASVRKVFKALTVDCNLTVYWAAERIPSKKDFSTQDVSIDADLNALRQSRHFVLLYPKPLASSVLFEAGYALALGRPSHYFVRTRDDLPFLMRELPDAGRHVRIHSEQDWKDYDDLTRRLLANRASWFPSG